MARFICEWGYVALVTLWDRNCMRVLLSVFLFLFFFFFFGNDSIFLEYILVKNFESLAHLLGKRYVYHGYEFWAS